MLTVIVLGVICIAEWCTTLTRQGHKSDKRGYRSNKKMNTDPFVPQSGSSCVGVLFNMAHIEYQKSVCSALVFKVSGVLLFLSSHHVNLVMH